jgi:hypothetical protein
VTFPSSTRRLRPTLGALCTPPHSWPLPGTPPSGTRIGRCRSPCPSCCGPLAGPRCVVMPGPWPRWLGPVLRPVCVGCGSLVRLRFALRSLALCRVCEVAPSFVSGWQTFSSVSRLKAPTSTLPYMTTKGSAESNAKRWCLFLAPITTLVQDVVPRGPQEALWP